MKFYRENKINPLASCLPLLLQLPVFISLFYMLRTDLKLDICGDQLREFYSQALQAVVTNSQIPERGAVTASCGPPSRLQHDVHRIDGAAHTVAPGSAKFLFLPDITTRPRAPR